MLPKLSETIYCSKAGCNAEAHRVIAGLTEYWPVCNRCVDVFEWILALWTQDDIQPTFMPMEDYRVERDHMNITKDEERGSFPYSYVEGEGG